MTSELWTNCIKHVIKEDKKMWDLDIHIEITIEPVVVNLNEDNTTGDEYEDMFDESEDTLEEL